MSETHTVSCEIGGKTVTIETGKLARQANGSVLVSYGDTRVLVTACAAKDPRPGQSFFPLTVEYSEKFYSAGKIPGSFFRREGRPSADATLSARLLDRPIRPLFPKAFMCDTQVVVSIISLDPEFDPEFCASVGVSAALHISDIPFGGPSAGLKIGRVSGQIVFNPTWKQLNEESDLELLLAGTKSAIMMVEGGCKEIPEKDLLQIILQGHDEIKKINASIEELREKCGKPKVEVIEKEIPADVTETVTRIAKEGLIQSNSTKDKGERYQLVDDLKKKVMEELVPESLEKSDPDAAADRKTQASAAFKDLHADLMRKMVLKEGQRIDGRDLKSVRQITTEVDVLPRAHGSALFTRGETQVMASITLGTSDDEQIVDSLYENSYRKFMLHYNFPPFSVGETGRMGGQSRREIGHGNLAERAIKAVFPKYEDFPYTVRLVCETLESNGSSSMASVCGASMASMAAGVPFPKPVAGIAMGLIKEGSDVAILSDILGDEDHLGDMDFKVAGTKDGVTAIQMDIKIEGVDRQIMETALAQAHEGRLHILAEMAKTIAEPRKEMSAWAPKITAMKIAVDKIASVIGPSGKIIKGIIAETGAKVDVEDDGTIRISAVSQEAGDKAIQMIQDITADVEIDKVYKGKVKKIVDFGAFVGVLPNKDGLLHISEIAHERVGAVEDFFKEGDEVEVKVIDVDRDGKVRLSRKALLEVPEGMEVRHDRGDRGDRGGRGDRGRGGRGDRGRGGRGGGRGGDRGGRGGGGGRGGDRDRGGRSYA